MNYFVAEVRKDNEPNFIIHPKINSRYNFIVTFVEPQTANQQAIGLNIAFEKNRLNAALLAQNSGQTT